MHQLGLLGLSERGAWRTWTGQLARGPERAGKMRGGVYSRDLQTWVVHQKAALKENRVEQVCLWDQESVFMRKSPGVANSQVWILVCSLLELATEVSCAGFQRRGFFVFVFFVLRQNQV